MDTSDSVLLQDIAPRLLGDRLRAARLARGWTQTDLAGDVCSVGYVSRLESGQRRPNATVLEALSLRLGIAIDELLRGPTARQQDEIKLAIDFAELALESGDVVEAESQARTARDRARALPSDELADRATFLVALALEKSGSMDDAILELEALLSAGDRSLLAVRAAIALSRCYRESGDFAQAIDAGERVAHELAGSPLEMTDEAVQLAVTVAAAYYERGDTGQAVRICRKAIDKADQLDSAKARASAYWNASIMEADRGQVRHAIPLAERALALLGEGQGGRNLARLHSVLADLQLQLDPPELGAAHANVAKADEGLRFSSASPIDLARNRFIGARATLLAGDYASAHEVCAEIFEAVVDQAPDLAADACTVMGQASSALGDTDAATAAYRRAVMLLTAIGADRSAAQLWFELAGLLEDVGDFETARTAYRSAAASVGLRGRPTVTSGQGAIDRIAIDQLAIDQLAID